MAGFDGLVKELERLGKSVLDGVSGWGGRSGSGAGRDAGRAAREFAVRSAAQTACGGSTFVGMLALSQYFQGAVLRVSCSSGMGVSTALGLSTVALASAASLRIADVVDSAMSPRRSWLFSDGENASEALQRAVVEPPSVGEAGAASFGVVLYRALGGTLNGVAPSALHLPGAFSRFVASLPATLEYASDAERQALGALGKLCGCHTCGTRAPASYVADHMPPLKTVKLANAVWWRRLLGLKLSQRFYPQCQSCSTLQSAAVRSGSTVLKYHVGPQSLRAHHATGALLVLGSLLMHERWWEGGGSGR